MPVRELSRGLDGRLGVRHAAHVELAAQQQPYARGLAHDGARELAAREAIGHRLHVPTLPWVRRLVKGHWAILAECPDRTSTWRSGCSRPSRSAISMRWCSWRTES